MKPMKIPPKSNEFWLSLGGILVILSGFEGVLLIFEVSMVFWSF